MSAAFEEKRRFPRVKFRTGLRYQIRGLPEVKDTLSDDISIGGLGFSNSEFIAPRTALNLEINILAHILKTQGLVTWSSPLPRSDKYHIGVEFAGLNLDDKNYLGDYIDMQLGKI
jgi:hypothetical protein